MWCDGPGFHTRIHNKPPIRLKDQELGAGSEFEQIRDDSASGHLENFLDFTMASPQTIATN
jgi:hypothetical protein